MVEGDPLSVLIQDPCVDVDLPPVSWLFLVGGFWFWSLSHGRVLKSNQTCWLLWRKEEVVVRLLETPVHWSHDDRFNIFVPFSRRDFVSCFFSGFRLLPHLLTVWRLFGQELDSRPMVISLNFEYYVTTISFVVTCGFGRFKDWSNRVWKRDSWSVFFTYR